jgi:hypothetical protein
MDIEIWLPSQATFAGDAQTRHEQTRRLVLLGRHVDDVAALVHTHLPEFGIEHVVIWPGEPRLNPVGGDGDLDYQLSLGTRRRLYSGDGPGSVTPIVEGIHAATGLWGLVQGMWSELPLHLRRHALVRLRASDLDFVR